jgi:RnfABCDGE-type electron transport complex G subunit
MMRLVVVLAAISFVSALALGFVYESASPRIEKQKLVADELARRSVLPEAVLGVFVPVETDGFVYYRGYRNADTTDLVGYTLKARGRGYASYIETIVGVDSGGRITGIKITSEQETPGLGTKIEEVKSTKTVLDALKEAAGKGAPKKVSVEIVGDGARRSVEVEIKDTALCADLAKAIATHDTAGVMMIASKTIAVGGADAALLSNPALTYEVSNQVVRRIRQETAPWWQAQFIGKSRGELVLGQEKSDRSVQAITGATVYSKAIQAITGATVSSRAVTESVKDAIVRLESTIGGFGEGIQ